MLKKFKISESWADGVLQLDPRTGREYAKEILTDEDAETLLDAGCKHIIAVQYAKTEPPLALPKAEK